MTSPILVVIDGANALTSAGTVWSRRCRLPPRPPNAQLFAKPFKGRWQPSLLAQREGGVRTGRRRAQIFGLAAVVCKWLDHRRKKETPCMTATTIY
jgi:hypothetical protein